jgi:hypothetical protein
VPVSGSIGDPEYSYGRVVRRAITNLLTGIVAAPFRALGSLFGGDQQQEPSELRFKSGSAELIPRERERIARIATALQARPLLVVSVPSGIEPVRDAYAVRRLKVRRDIAQRLGFELEADEDPGPVSYVNARSQRALENLLEEREGEQATDTFAGAFARDQKREPQRVNPALVLLGKASEDREFYRALYLHLVNSTPLPDTELDALAKARADAVIADFKSNGFAAERLTVGARRKLVPARPSGVMLPLELTTWRKSPRKST